ncbi:PREDICTED: uncharacterized protein LOC107880935 [Prunus mume]|uniref:Uncharacterized protein LOC107880935 n=1 Tax=Prunus mume TaxID=102107 RepID=A0ABM1LNN8_PRUMU|nr:PREDICTED: uncharacterized protein LOC107880935 [Prunus mume]
MDPHYAAQDALLKVHNRIVEEDLFGGVTFDDDNENSVVTARLLVPNKMELESIVDPVHRETKNLTDRMTPRALFTTKHKELVKEGAKSMKETATSCFKWIYELKLVHFRTYEFLECMCKEIKKKHLHHLQVALLHEAIFRAVERGHVEFIDLLRKAHPDILRITDGRGRNIFQYAIGSRQEKVYNLIYTLDKNERNATINSTDKFNNGILHAAGNLYLHLDKIQGAALQMQRELQWFKEVESIVPPNVLELTNSTNGLTAQELFSKNHKELVKEGERSMKDTATLCTVASALIVTMMFAAAFTVPGGIRGDTGFPMFLRKPLFTVFIISDSVSLFSSTTSVMIFLGILTSRYAEKDFLKSLPTKTILGLSTLFFSITSMMIAFLVYVLQADGLPCPPQC